MRAEAQNTWKYSSLPMIPGGVSGMMQAFLANGTFMSTKLIIITAQSKIGWANLGSDKPQQDGTIATIKPPPNTVQWFVQRRASDGVRWWPIKSTAQVSPDRRINGAVSDPEKIQDDILTFLGDFNLQVSYETAGGKGPQRKTRSLRLSDRAWENIQNCGGAAMVEEWALKL